ncbi:MAG: MCE family protein [Bacteroidetes bacterium]|nr:MCE family protein [Bacteroidota bacterium]MCA6443372.1 MCE family protein [Bacteroidota bacterium]
MDNLSRNTKLGIFVFAGTFFFIVLLYFIGSKRNLFSSTIDVYARFYDAEGLMKGNSIRYSGINIGTVKNVAIENDSTVLVTMVIQKQVIKYIKKNSLASIGTDGLMGNKLVNITNVSEASETINEGDEFKTLKAISTAEMLKTLSVTNENVRLITDDLKKIASKVNNNNSLWNFLSDTVLGNNLKQAIVSIKLTGDRTAYIAGDFSKMLNDVRDGKGVLGALLVDTALSGKLNQSIVSIKMISSDLAVVSGDLSYITKKVKGGEGAVGTLLTDTEFVHNMNKSMANLNTGTQGFSENMEALKHSIFLRKYFKKKQKEKNPAAK